MASESKGNFIMISPHESMNTFPIAIFYINGVGEEDTTEYYPIMSNFYNTALWLGTGTLMDVNNDPVPPQALGYHMVNRIEYNRKFYWLSKIGINSLIYCAIEDGGTVKITINTTDDWNTYTVVTNSGGVQ